MQEKISKQKIYIEKVRKLNEGKNLKYIVLTMGCQLNENDSEKISGMLEEMGYSKTDKIEDANVVAFNTCCVRENAEDRLFGKLGEVKKYKETNSTIIAIGGCMMQEKHIVDKLKHSYPFFDIVFGTHTLYKFPEDIYNAIVNGKQIEDIIDIDGEVIEGLPIKRDDNIKASVAIMNGCNNFCTYCIVPYVRGRERSRKAEDIIAERILMLGGVPENKFSEYLKVANVKEVSDISCGSEAVDHILETYGYLIGEERKVIELANEAGDDVTADLMTGYLKEQEKMVWMLVAFNTKSCTK